MNSLRRELSLFALLAAGLLAWLFRDALLHGLVLGQTDLLYQFPPWVGYAPRDWTPRNWLLLDSPTQFVPFLIHARDAVLEGRLPLWTNQLGSGQPFLAAFQTAVLSPFSLIGYVFPLPGALTWMAAARLMVGGAGMFLFLRTRPLGGVASTVGGVAYLLNPFSVAWLEHPHASVAAWLPWILLTTSRAVRSPSRNALAWGGVVATLSILSAHPETAFKVYLLAGAYALYLAGGAPQRWRGLACAGGAVVLGLALSAVQVLPFLEYLDLSRILAARGEATGPLFTNNPLSMVTMFVPDFFGTPLARRYVIDGTNYIEQQAYPGLLIWLLAAVSLCARRQRRLAVFFIAAAVVSALIMYGTWMATLATTIVPPLRVTALSRFGLLFIAGLIVAASVGLDDLLDRANRRVVGLLPIVATVAAGLVIVATVAVFLSWQGPRLEAGRQLSHTLASAQLAGLLLAASVICIGLCMYWPRVGGVAATAVLAVDLLFFANGLHPLTPRDAVYPTIPELAVARNDPGLFRVGGWEDALYPNTVLAYGLQDYRSYDAMGVRDYAALLDVGFRWNGAFHSLVNFATPTVLDLLNVKYIVAPPAIDAPADRFTLVAHTPTGIYRNDRVLPRAFLADHWEQRAGNNARRAIRDGSVDLRRTVLLEEPLTGGQQVSAATGSPGEATVTRYEHERATITTEADGGRLLVLTDTHYPGWVATVDGAAAEILRANYAFRAVFVPAGRHEVVFTYRPASVRWGASISAAALLCLVLLASGVRRARLSSQAIRDAGR